MQYTRLGSTGMKVSHICLGTMTFGSSKWRNWVYEEEESLPFFKHALEQGINFFDTADFYSIGVCEEVVGKALKEFANRDEVVLASKLYYAMSDDPNDRGLSRKHIFKSIDRSLQRLQTDFLDLYQIHRWDDETPIEETMEALHEVVKSGKARYIGASSMYAWQFMKAQAVAEKNGWAKFVSMQNHYNLMYREEEREMIPCCIDQGVGVIPWSPLARGLLTGKKTSETSIRKDNDALGLSGVGSSGSAGEGTSVRGVQQMMRNRQKFWKEPDQRWERFNDRTKEKLMWQPGEAWSVEKLLATWPWGHQRGPKRQAYL